MTNRERKYIKVRKENKDMASFKKKWMNRLLSVKSEPLPVADWVWEDIVNLLSLPKFSSVD